MFGNGASWYIVENGKKLMIDTVRGEVELIPNYEGTPCVDMQTYDILYRFLMQTEMHEGYTSEYTSHYEMRACKDALIKACKDNEVKFTNGGQWFVNHHSHRGVVVMYDISSAGKVVRYQMSAGASWQYKQHTPGFMQIDKDTINHL